MLVSRTRTALRRRRDRPRRRRLPARRRARRGRQRPARRARARRRRRARRGRRPRGRAGPRGAGAGGRPARAGRRTTPTRWPRSAARRPRDLADRPRDPGAGVQPDGRARRRAARARGRARRAPPTTSRCSPTCCAARPPSAARRPRSSATSATGGTCASGSAPTPASGCSRAHRDLLALDRPVRSGVRYDATALRRPRPRPRPAARAAGRARGWSRSSGRAGSARRGSRTSSRATRAQPVVHVVELVGVTAAEDVVGEVGSVLGVRDSVSGRRTLTARAAGRRPRPHRAAARRSRRACWCSTTASTSIDAVAELVAFLVSATADLRVLTTSRAPLAIAAERVYLLGELEPADAAALFRERALAARPERPSCPSEVVRSIVDPARRPAAGDRAGRGQGAGDVGRGDRPAARGPVRAAARRRPQRARPPPDPARRHRLVVEPARRRRAARAAPAGAVPRRVHARGGGRGARRRRARRGPGPRRPVAAERPRGAGRASATGCSRPCASSAGCSSSEAGEDGEARAAQRALGDRATPAASTRGLSGRDQFAAIDALAAEETNLADELRGAIADGDRGALVQLLAALGLFWTIRGEHVRLLVLAGAVADAVRDWQPPPELEDAARAALAITLTNTLMVDAATGGAADPRRCCAAGPGRRRPAARRAGRGCCSRTTRRDAGRVRCRGSSSSPTTPTATSRCPPRQWLSHVRENAGDPAGAIEAAAARAGARPATTTARGPRRCSHTMLAAADACTSATARPAIEHARAALPVMRAARRDATTSSSCARCSRSARSPTGGSRTRRPSSSRIDRIDDSGTAVRRGRLPADRPRRAGAGPRRPSPPGCASTASARPRMRELRLPGDRADRRWSRGRCSAKRWRSARTPTTRRGADDAHGRGAVRAPAASARCGCSTRRTRTSTTRSPGWCCSRLGAWGLLRRRGAAPTTRSRLLALADRFAYNRMIPTMAWERIAPARRGSARRAGSPRCAAEYGDRRAAGPARRGPAAVERLPAEPASRLEVPLVAAHRERREDRDHDQAGEQRPADLGW